MVGSRFARSGVGVGEAAKTSVWAVDMPSNIDGLPGQFTLQRALCSLFIPLSP